MQDAPRAAGRAPGEDDVNPYREVDIEELPEWWRENIEEFRAHGMRPYRPARFRDDTLVPILVEELRERWGVEVMFRAIDPQMHGRWKICVDGVVVREVEHERSGDGYSVYDIDSNEFMHLVQRGDSDVQSSTRSN